MNTDTQTTLGRIKAADEANDNFEDRIYGEMIRKCAHNNLDMMPAGTQQTLETAEAMLHNAQDIYSMFMKECFLSLKTNKKWPHLYLWKEKSRDSFLFDQQQVLQAGTELIFHDAYSTATEDCPEGVADKPVT